MSTAVGEVRSDPQLNTENYSVDSELAEIQSALVPTPTTEEGITTTGAAISTVDQPVWGGAAETMALMVWSIRAHAFWRWHRSGAETERQLWEGVPRLNNRPWEADMREARQCSFLTLPRKLIRAMALARRRRENAGRRQRDIGR